MVRIARGYIDLKHFFDKFNKVYKDRYHRYRSFDICYNFFLNNGRHLEGVDLEKSCVYLAAYLASWGMYRGSTEILQKNAMCLKHVISYISRNDGNFRNIDLHQYNNNGVQEKILAGYTAIESRLKEGGFMKPTPTLITKIMLGVWACVPAFDEYFNKGMQKYCGRGFLTVNPKKKLRKIAEFCGVEENLHHLRGLSVRSNLKMAKVLDMCFFKAGSGP